MTKDALRLRLLLNLTVTEMTKAIPGRASNSSVAKPSMALCAATDG
jgi:hypothetical protein